MSAPGVTPRERRMPGETGIWLFILGDMVVFAIVFGVLVHTRGEDPAAYELGQSQLHIGLGILNTVILLTSSLLVAMGVQVSRGADHARARGYFKGAIVCALAFAALKAVEYTDLATSGHGPGTGDFQQYFFSFTGLHLLHVAIGLAVLGGILRMLRRPALDDHDAMMLESGASYWHMVDLLWIVLFALLYLLG